MGKAVGGGAAALTHPIGTRVPSLTLPAMCLISDHCGEVTLTSRLLFWPSCISVIRERKAGVVAVKEGVPPGPPRRQAAHMPS